MSGSVPGSASRIEEVFIATPDQAIADAVRAFGGSVLMTRGDHQTGTDRLAEAAQQLAPEVSVIVNVQGDEPLIDPEIIDAAAEPLLEDDGLAMSSLCCPLPEGREGDPNVVKVVLTKDQLRALFLALALALPPQRRCARLPAPPAHRALCVSPRFFRDLSHLAAYAAGAD